MCVILILTHAKDDCASLVEEHLTKENVDFVRFNTETFQEDVKVTLHMEDDGSFNGCFYFPGRKVDFKKIGVIWNRRIHDPEIKTKIFESEPEIKDWILKESIGALNLCFSLLSLKIPIVNPWDLNEKLKSNKWIQMQKASSLGLKVPLSCVTNNIEDIKNFWLEAKKEIIFKKIKKGLFEMSNGDRFLIHTSKIPEESFSDEFIQRMRFAPIFLQSHIPKKYDIRSVIVGEKVFSFAIFSQEIPEALTDYRTAFISGQLDNMRHEVIDLGPKINKTLVDFTKSFGLTFNTIDLIRTPQEELIFLENNANGQWGWLEIKTGEKISKAFADLLKKLANID